jgi:hypothetical protein
MSSKIAYTIFLMIISSGAYACSCIPEVSIVNSFKNADIVFEGKVIKIDTVFISDTVNIISPTNPKPHIEVITRKYFEVKFNISRIFKGNNRNKTIAIITDVVGTQCGYQFAHNFKYIVYGYGELFNLIDSGIILTNQKPDIKTKTLSVLRYSTNSCTRTTRGIKYEISELKKNKLI